MFMLILTKMLIAFNVILAPKILQFADDLWQLFPTSVLFLKVWLNDSSNKYLLQLITLILVRIDIH